jgi:hypothetical protein
MCEQGAHEKFLTDIMTLNDAPDFLYHAKLLQIIGTPDDQIRWWFLDGFGSFAIRPALRDVGLTLRSATPPDTQSPPMPIDSEAAA